MSKTKTQTKPKIESQDEADVVEYLKGIGSESGSTVSIQFVFPSYVVGAARHTRTLTALAERFNLSRIVDGPEYTMIVLDQALFDACDEWVQAHQED